MKRNGGVMFALALLFAGTRLTTRPAQPSPAVTQADVSNAHEKDAGLGITGCPAFSDPPLENGPGSDGKITSLVGRYLYGASASAKVRANSIPENIRFMVATVPDPLHTHLSLQFDRTLEALQQAMQDEGYTYDSSWLPWKHLAATYQTLQDEETDEKNATRRELCPGLILFRRSMNAHRSGNSPPCKLSGAEQRSESYLCGMFVFLVAETPTSGLNQIQWQNAQWWMNTYLSRERPDKALRILGPNFSGSIPTVTRALDVIDPQQSPFKSALLYTGRIRGCSSWRWLNEQLKERQDLPVRTSDFDENDAVLIDRFYRYLKDRGHALSEVAILSEDETAYGGLPDPPHPQLGSPQVPSELHCEPPYMKVNKAGQPTNQPVHLYYPRDISAIKSAYREQSIFSTASSTDTSNSTHTILQPRPELTSHEEMDSIEQFSGQGIALTQEAQLYGIINSLRSHAIRFVILRSTNSLDSLFLTRFIHRAYPDAYIAMVGTDMLFGREVDSTEFRGVVALSSFPLLPRGQDWTMQTSAADLVPQHAHRVFGSDIMEGVYLAARFLTTDCEVREDLDDCGKKTLQSFVHPSKPDLPDYAEPFWENEPQQLSASTWMSVIGRDGYWPVEVLKEPYFEDRPVASNLTKVSRPHDISGNAGRTATGWFSLSTAWKFVCFLAVLLACTHGIASTWGWRRSDLSVFIQFTPLSGNRQLALKALGWAIVCSLMLLLFLVSARMYPWLRGIDQVWVWLVGGCAAGGCIAAIIDLKSGPMTELKDESEDEPKEESNDEPNDEPDDERKDAKSDAPNDVPNDAPKARSGSRLWIVLMAGIVAVSALLGFLIFDYRHPSGVTIAYRSVHLTSGVSPMVSLLLMLVGFYWWFWQALSGLSLMGPGRPILPQLSKQSVSFSRVSCEMARGIEATAIPFPDWNSPCRWLYLTPLILLSLLALVMQRPWTLGFDAIVHSLESESFNWTLHGFLAIGIFLLIFDCCQLLMSWFSLKRLLLALNRLPLRRTFAAFQGLSMHSLWSMSGTSSRMRYTVFSHQIESLVHLRNQLDSFDSRNSGTRAVRFAVRRAIALGMEFIVSRSEGPDLAMANDYAARKVRRDFSRCTEKIVRDLLIPEWFAAHESLDLRDPSIGSTAIEYLPLSEEQSVKLAEEFVCLIYIGYLQNMIARMRTMVLSMAGVFATIALSVAFYPYTPRLLLSISLLISLLVLGAVVALVYAGLDRDSTLSHITNTQPGNLGLNFWLRILSFVGVPALGLIVAQFPEIADFVGSWIQPGLNSVK